MSGWSSTRGADCSGSVYYGIKHTIDKNFGRPTANSLFYSNKVVPIDTPEEGDLMFYDYGGKGHISHVTTVLDNDMMIHASSGSGYIMKVPTNYVHARERYYRRIVWSNF